MSKSNFVTIGAVIIALTETTKDDRVSKRTAKEILAEIKKVFPSSETTEKSIYSTVCRANISMPGSNRSAVDIKAFESLMKRLNKTGTTE